MNDDSQAVKEAAPNANLTQLRLRRADIFRAARGFMMGTADLIPGVSGGTVALIVGIYERLVTAISHVDGTFLDHIAHLRLRAAADHIDLRFLLALGGGIMAAILSLSKLMTYLLLNHFGAISSVFFGLILASSFLVARMVERWSMTAVLCGVAGAIFAFWLVGNLPSVPPTGNGYVFACGMIGICAMILPGISGSFILLLMGKYGDIMSAISSLTDGTATQATIVTLAVFGLGCLVGLLGFSKILRWLLTRYESATMATLCGFLFGSLRKIWPFKKDVTLAHLDVYGLAPEEIQQINDDPSRLGEFVKVTRRISENVWPDQIDGQVITYLLLAIGAALAVLLLDYVARGGAQTAHPLSEDE